MIMIIGAGAFDIRCTPLYKGALLFVNRHIIEEEWGFEIIFYINDIQ